MQLTFVILILCWSLHNSTSHPPIPEWRQSRFIIDNRRNALFTHREPTAQETGKKLYPFPVAGKLFPPERYQKDLNAEASIREPSYLEKYKDNSLPGEVTKTQVKAQNEFQRNTSSVDYDPHSLIPGEVVRFETGPSTENQSWASKIEELSSSTGKAEVNEVEETTLRQNLGYGRIPWSIKAEEANQIDREKHVYETRIETVSYHQEVIFNPPKPDTEWFGRKERQGNKNLYDTEGNSTREERERNYEESERNYEEPEQKYEESERHYEEPERNYEEPERNYEEPERNYEEPERNYEEPERNYEEPERNYEEPERNYEEPERNYEEPERNYEEPERNYEEPERNYEEPERNYEEPERNYEEPERNYKQNESSHIGKTYPPDSDENKNQFGYVVEDQNFRKYRVEERTPDGFIVGEYGVVSHDDGTLRGVRYTADSTANPQLIYDTLLKFLSL